MGVVDLPVTFNNGVGLIPTMNFGDQLFHVYRVYSGSLMGSSVLSRLSGGGTNFDIASYVDGDQLLWTPSGKTGSSTSASKGQITLTSNHTGVLKVAYSYTTGSTIPINEAITTYPMYRALRGSGETGEFSVAGDAYSFSNRAFRLLAEKFPENSRWAQSAAANLRSAKRAATTEMPNPKLLSVRVGSTDALSGASFYDGRSGSTLTRDATSGIVHLQVPGASGGAVAIYENISRYWSVSDSQNTVLKVSANADIAVPLSIGLQTSQAFDTNTYYEADFIADGGGDALLTKEFRRQDFYKWSNAQYIAPRNGSSVFSGGGGLAATSLESISANGGNFLMTTKFTFDETGGGYAGGVSNISTPFALGSLASIKIAYKVSGGPARIRVRDSNGYNWSFDLSSTTFTETTIQLSDWFKDGYLPAPGGVTAPAAGNVQEVQFVPIPGQSTTLWVWYVGQSAPIQLPAGSGIYATKVAAIDINPHTLSIGDVEILRPGNAYTEFGPGLLPFAESIYASSVSDTTYMSYTSYQDPNLWIDAEEWSLLDNMVSYHQASQMNYQDQSPGGSVLGPFTPVYYWPHMQALELGASPGTWSFNGFDSFGSWNGFQGRNAANLARAWWRLKDDAGHLPTSLPTIVINYLVWLDSFLTSNSDAFPAVFGPSSIPSTASSPDPHFAALTLKAAIYARLAGASEQVTSRLIRKSYSHLMSVLEYRESQADLGLLWTDSSEKKSAGYWYGEALEALVLMERYHSILSL
jgi:hypothetical protein